MDGNIARIQADIEKFIRSKANGRMLDLGNNFKLYYIKTLVDTSFITRDIQQVLF